ncbi:MAG: CGNR zinc finger domain-containing protein [Methylovirgula sp.]
MALDFVNSRARPSGDEVEWIANGEDLLEWLIAAGLLSREAAQGIRSAHAPAALDETAARARDLREWFRHFAFDHAGRPLAAEALGELARLNALLECDELFRVIAIADSSRGGSGDQARVSTFECRPVRRWRTPDSLLAPIAEAMADLVCTADFTQVKKCEGAGCTLLFLDRTKGHKRRWCSMAVCGNRAKQAIHRARLRDSVGGRT